MNKVKKTALFLVAAFSFIIIGGVMDAMAFVPTKNQWRKKKKEFNLPNGLTSKVKLGKTFDKYQKEINIRDPRDAIKTIDTFVPKLATYMKALKAYKKTTRNKKPIKKKEAFAYLKEIMGDTSKLKKNMENMLKPGLAVKNALAKAQRKAKRLKANSPQSEFQKFNSEEYRGVGTKFSSLKKKCASCREAMKAFAREAKIVDTMVSAKQFKGKKILKKIKESLSTLKAGLDTAGAW